MKALSTLHIDVPDELSEVLPLLLSQECSLLYASPAYIALLREYLSMSRFEGLVVRANGGVVGFFPLFFRINDRLGNVCNSLPYYGSNGGILTEATLSPEVREHVRSALLEKALQRIGDYDCVSATVITNPMDPQGGAW